jgi:nucleotide-binding universal stress UspA family protein
MKVLVALDDSPVSARAARAAGRLFGSNPDTEFYVINVSVVPVPWVGGIDYGFVSPMLYDARWADPTHTDDDLERALAERAEAVGLADAETVVRTGDPVDQICTAAESYGVDVIVVGSHDKSALQRLVDPSVASGVVRGTSLPVVVVSGSP